MQNHLTVGTTGQIGNTRNRPAGTIYMNNISTLLGQEQWINEFRCYEVKIEESERPATTGS